MPVSLLTINCLKCFFRIDEDLGMDFGPDDAMENTIEEAGPDVSEGGIEMKREKTRRKMMAENRAILSLIEEPNEAGKCWSEQPDGCIFTCFLCSAIVDTFSRICDHMDNIHPLDPAMYEGATEESPPAVYQCIACPKRFKKKTHLKVNIMLFLSNESI